MKMLQQKEERWGWVTTKSFQKDSAATEISWLVQVVREGLLFKKVNIERKKGAKKKELKNVGQESRKGLPLEEVLKQELKKESGVTSVRNFLGKSNSPFPRIELNICEHEHWQY